MSEENSHNDCQYNSLLPTECVIYRNKTKDVFERKTRKNVETGRLKMRDIKMWHNIAEMEIAGQAAMESQTNVQSTGKRNFQKSQNQTV